MGNRVFNFSAGPAVLPLPVLEKAQQEMLDFQGCGMSVMEMSHRSKPFEGVLAKADQGLRNLLGISEDYAVLFLQGGASMQFAMVPMNLYEEGKPVDVIHTGAWTKKAIEEIQNLASMRYAANMAPEKYMRLPKAEELDFNPDASYVHMCSNNTIFGTQWRWYPDTGQVPLVADMSSDILSHPVDVSKFGLIFAGAQKNAGPAGVTIVIIRKDLAERVKATVPTMLRYKIHIENNSLYNTPPCYPIYIVSLVTEWLEGLGGLQAMEKINQDKAKILYDAIDTTDFYYCPVNKEDRSTMNVVFRIQGNNEELEAQFIKEATQTGLSGLKGHRSVGGLRASIYNAHPVEGVQALASFMKDFEKKNG
ncbi:MAG: 3-phosphoserine/phosphohydroxythreonine transaminase [bacterium]|jgi:phosphoserine aminotransferase|nr:3-phosphoserine/phosphohydroxythreonine transaminase [bacterium]